MNRRSLLFRMACSLGALRFHGIEPLGNAQAYTPPGDFRGEWRVIPDPKLPNVLLIGDSISIGYTRDVRELLRGKGNVLRPMTADGLSPVNCDDTSFGLEHLSSWLGTAKWDAIHFNWGLHDLCYYHDATKKLYNNRDKIHGIRDVPLPQYRENLEKLTGMLERTGAVLIWASTTVVPEGEAGRFVGDDVKYNRAAKEVMVERGIRIDDLYALTKTFPPNLFSGPGNVHFTKEGYLRIARQVAAQVQAALAERAHRA